MNEMTYLGTGMKFPPQIDPGTGRFAVSSGAQSVRESVYLILMTNRGERWLEPEFGSQMSSYLFMDTSPTMLRIMTNEIKEMILRQEPRIDDLNVEIDSDREPDCLLIYLSYHIAASNTEENLVFPFYLHAQREEMET